MQKSFVTLVAAAMLAVATSAAAQTGGDMTEQDQQLIRRVQADRRAVVLPAMNLTGEETAVFTPIYNEYQAAMKEQYKRGAELLNKYASNYDSMTDDAAKDILKEVFEQREERADILKKYAKRMSGKLPATKVLRFVQIENKLNALLDWQAAQVIPLVR